ncbi:hypothetical protein MTR04_10160 [Staphylococcus agnetis]|uniref:hypothetical protein n=1 Tax=Staphylococcus agnetis TaxID=985762 RepID=UPI00208EF624|nr:hypothetical protein [Staphylococcus agnetis]MCO4360679.1 hypothetical protein [Staphylococcus agnetis]
MAFIVFILVILILLIIFTVNDKRVDKINKKYDMQIKNIIETYYTVDKVECIYRENEKFVLVFEDNLLNLHNSQIVIVEVLEDEKVEINAPLYNEIDINNLFELILGDTCFYISKVRYDGLLKY